MTKGKAMIEEYNYDPVRELRLNRPPVNAFDPALVHALTERLRAAHTDGQRAIVLSGSPGMFSGGLDIAALVESDAEGIKRFVRAFLELQYQIAISPIPVVTAITGHCAAGGTVLALFADYRVMARGSYRIGLNEVHVGVCAGRIIYGALRRLLGARRADLMMCFGQMVTADEALNIGLVDALADIDRVVLDAKDHAAALTRLPPTAYKTTRQMVRADLVKLLEGSARQDACDEIVESLRSPEAQAALRARLALIPGSPPR
jgi:3,2-trans-enoyl-CoA isomerase